jgi:dCTP deaminase
MTVLSKPDIEQLAGNGNIGSVQDDDLEWAIEPASMDLHLGDELKEHSTDGVVKVHVPRTYPDTRSRYISDSHGSQIIKPGEFVLGTTKERIEIPNGYLGLLHGRSSVGRLGLFIENAGLIDPGFEGEITLELHNAEDYPIALKEGMRIGQLTFHTLLTVPDVTYSERNGNKYDGQDGATASKLHEDFQ